MDVTKSSVSLVWSRPKHDGGSKLIGYYMEYTKLPGEKWTRCNANCMDIQTENYVVQGLEEGQQYQFRVIAKTAVNTSAASELSDPIAVIAENGTARMLHSVQHRQLLMLSPGFLSSHPDPVQFLLVWSSAST